MTAAEVKEYLKEIKFKRQYLERLKERRDNMHLDVSFGGIDYSADRIQNSPKNKLEEAMVRLSDKLEKIDKSIAKTTMDIDDRIGCIESLTDGNYKNILYRHYADYDSLKVISKDMGYAYVYVCTMHREALKELSKIIK